MTTPVVYPSSEIPCFYTVAERKTYTARQIDAHRANIQMFITDNNPKAFTTYGLQMTDNGPYYFILALKAMGVPDSTIISNKPVEKKLQAIYNQLTA